MSAVLALCQVEKGSTLPFEPTREQSELIAHDVDSHARVLAGPGTGKSSTLVALVNDIVTRTPPISKVRLLTFTRAATAELARKVSDSSVGLAQRPSTIHSFAISVLLRNPGVGGFPEPLRMADDWESREIIRPSLATRLGVSVRRLVELLREMSSNWESLEQAFNSEISPEDRAQFHGAWTEHREVYGYTLLAELPFALRRALRDHPDLEGVDYDVLIVDEYQDLNACDLEILKMIAERGCTIIGAGDDDQSIYSFRSAAPQGIRQFCTDYPGSADYPLSITHRCGRRILEWASFVIEGDVDRTPERPRPSCANGAPEGEVALLSFADNVAEARGIALLTQSLIQERDLSPSDILILFRSDFRGHFTTPVKEELENLGIPYSDPDAVNRVLADPANRRILAMVHLLARHPDSLAWATLLNLTNGIGRCFVETVYATARANRAQFGETLLNAFEDGFQGAPRAPASRATSLIESILAWLEQHEVPDDCERGWGQWILEMTGDGSLPSPSPAFEELLVALGEKVEPDLSLERFLGLIAPLGKDMASASSTGVRIMTLGGAKGLTVQAAIIGAVEDGIIPRPDGRLDEERRLLYVGMTRARRFLCCTWARRRTGPTARSGRPQVHRRRRHSVFLDSGPVASTDASRFLSPC